MQAVVEMRRWVGGGRANTHFLVTKFFYNVYSDVLLAVKFILRNIYLFIDLF